MAILICKTGGAIIELKEADQAVGYHQGCRETAEGTLGSFSFKDAQTVVGGPVEVVRVFDRRGRLDSDVVILINEEGRIRGLPKNNAIDGMDLYGPAIVISGQKHIRQVLDA